MFKTTLFWILWFSSHVSASPLLNLSESQSLTNDMSLVSKGGIFALGFFEPGNSKNRYLGIWYNKIPGQTVVWVANRINPVNDTSGVLSLITDDVTKATNLVLRSQSNKTVIWSTNSTRAARTPVLELLDSGNLVLRDRDDVKNYLWQSFDYPCDTLLPGMKLGRNKKTGLNRRLSAWKSPEDPSPGQLSWEMELHAYPEPVMWNGSTEFLRSGPWNGITFSGKPTKALPMLRYSFVSTDDETYQTITMVNESVIGRMMLDEVTFHRRSLIWSERDQNWTRYAALPRDVCDSYNLCGGNGFCSLSQDPNCRCLKRHFRPKLASEWRAGRWSEGCERKVRARGGCGNSDDGFARYEGLKLPDTTNTWVDGNLGLKECRAKCLESCNCTAYSNTDVRFGGRGCAIWFGDLLDMKQIPGGGQDIYVRVSASSLDNKNQKLKLGIIVVCTVIVILGMLLIYHICNKRRKIQDDNEKIREINEEEQEDLELPLYDLSTITSATDNFSIKNKLGEGGFGPVYKGRLLDGREIAVKRLSRSSGQGLKEFKNEVILIAKLQHRNLVKLLGCCIEGEEKLLIYEFMPNKSLDYFIFDEERGKMLDWSTRFNIICGIARGILYLHQDSRLRIVHRDLKASNVLLDNDMNPKISDFGLARTFGGDETEGNTRRVVGTYGYMAPEYAIEGQFSVKSDVFSFGILLLEIVTGKRSKGFYHVKNNLNLIGNAWEMWTEGRPLEMVDASIENNSCTISEVVRCIHICLLCVQQRPEDRPTMSSVVQMLGSDGALPEPAQPGFVMSNTQNLNVDHYSASTTQELASVNDCTVTVLHAR